MTNWNVPVLGQTTSETCWEAVGHMMWLWRYPGDEAGYRARAGQHLQMQHSFTTTETGQFYRLLGMLERDDAEPEFLRHQIHLGPLAVLVGTGDNLHAEVLVGCVGDNYTFTNPPAQAILNFGDDGADGPEVPQVGGTTTAPAADFSSPRAWWWPPHSS